MSATSVLFVCMGNICRSPTAHAVMRDKVAARRLADRISIDSAGTHAYHVGEMADSRSRQYAQSKGIEMDDLRSRKISVTDYDSFNYILAMDQDNFELIEYYAPSNHQATIAMFLSFANQAGMADRECVPDPYYGGAEGFADVFGLVDRGCEALIEHIVNNDL